MLLWQSCYEEAGKAIVIAIESMFMLNYVTSRTLHVHVSRHILYQITKTQTLTRAVVTFRERHVGSWSSSRLKSVQHISTAGLISVWVLKQIFFSNVLLFFGLISVQIWRFLLVACSLKLPETKHTAVMPTSKAFTVKKFKCISAETQEIKIIFLHWALMQTKMVFLNSQRFFMYTHQVSPLDSREHAFKIYWRLLHEFHHMFLCFL